MRQKIFLARWLAALLLLGFAAGARADGVQPEFSWARVPLYAHLGKTSGDFSPAEIQFLASHFALVTIEKAQALDQRGSTESGTVAAVAALKRANPHLTVLVYWNAFVDYQRMYDSLRTELPADWFLDDRPMPTGGALVRRFDPSNAAFRGWWIETGAKLVSATGADGVFVDAIVAAAGHPAQLAVRFGPARAAAIVSGAKAMLSGLRQRLGNGKLVIFNGLRAMQGGWPDGGLDFLSSASGAMVEDFDFGQFTAPQQIAADLELIRAAEARGKIVLVKAWPTVNPPTGSSESSPTLAAGARRDLDFPLACFLAVAERGAYFGYAWGFRAENGWFQTYDEFNRALGPPLGPAVRHGLVFEREFQHASVRADLAAKSATIRWH